MSKKIMYFSTVPFYSFCRRRYYLLAIPTNAEDDDYVVAREVARKTLSEKLLGVFRKTDIGRKNERLQWRTVHKYTNTTLQVHISSWKMYQLRHFYMQSKEFSLQNFNGKLRVYNPECFDTAYFAAHAGLLELMQPTPVSMSQLKRSLHHTSQTKKLHEHVVRWIFREYNKHIESYSDRGVILARALANKNQRLAKFLTECEKQRHKVYMSEIRRKIEEYRKKIAYFVNGIDEFKKICMNIRENGYNVKNNKDIALYDTLPKVMARMLLTLKTLYDRETSLGKLMQNLESEKHTKESILIELRSHVYDLEGNINWNYTNFIVNSTNKSLCQFLCRIRDHKNDIIEFFEYINSCFKKRSKYKKFSQYSGN